MSLFSTLGTGYSGLSVAEVETATTGHNIANANNDYYTRQRVITSAATPFHSTPGDIGGGVKISQITRIHDEFVYSRYKDSSNVLSHDSYMQQTLEEIAKDFPDLQNLGISNDMKNYFNSWNDLASNANEGSQKIALVQNASTMASDISDTRTTLRDLQNSINKQVKANIDEVNSIGKRIAGINIEIAKVESTKPNQANDLRDQRDHLELTLSKILDVSAFKSDISSKNTVDANATDQGVDYHLNIAGSSFVDGSSFHPLVIENSGNESDYYSIYSESQDGTKYDLTDKIRGGKVGAMLDLRGRTLDKTSNNGFPTDGAIQGYIDDMDTFANSLIVQTNNIYAKSASVRMISPAHSDISADTPLLNTNLNLKAGSFNLVMYDNNGVKVGEKTITIKQSTSMDNDSITDSIVKQINSNTDDNKDNNSTNDIDDYFTASYGKDGTFSIEPNPDKSSQNYTISFEDNGTNFPGAIGINRFFTGDSAKNISVKSDFLKDPSLMQGYQAPVEGNNDVANDMVQLQYNDIDFFKKDGTVNQDTLNGFYNSMTTKIATDGEDAGRQKETSQALFNTVQTEFQSISGVSTDEELTNLIKFQTAYSANAKVITTVDRMLNTLLGIKQ